MERFGGLNVAGVAGVAGVAFDREQQLMKLPAYAALSGAIVEVAEGTLETAKCPVQR